MLITNIRIEVYERNDEDWAYRIKSKNGQVLLHSEGYSSKGNAKNAMNKFLEDINLSQSDILIEEIE